MTILRKCVSKLKDSVKLSIIKDFKEFEKNGSIGNCSLRDVARAFLKDHNIPNENITLWMNALANECFRFYAELYLYDNDLYDD